MPDVVAKAFLPATAGEWVQGWIDGREALVSLVVDWKGSVELCRGEADVTGRLDEKAREAFALARKICGEDVFRGLFPVVRNPLPRARGFATSTMDIAGVLAVCFASAGVGQAPEELFSHCASIEPSDGIMFEGLALVDHIGGELIERLPSPPPLDLLVVIPDDTLDTAEYRKNERRMERVKGLARDHERAYAMLREGLSKQDSSAIAEAATLSATLQQQVLPRAEWNLLREASAAFGALGIAAAHSGTASALIFEGQDKERLSMARRWLGVRMRDVGNGIVTARVCGGGISLFM